MLRLILPPKSSDHTLDAPPPGLIPVKNKPSCIATEFGNINLAKEKLIWKRKEMIKICVVIINVWSNLQQVREWIERQM